MADDILAFFAKNIRMVEDSFSSTNDDIPFSTPAAVDQCTQAALQQPLVPEIPMVPPLFLLSASTPVSDASVEPQYHENTDLGQPAETCNHMEEIHCLATRIITEVISVATQEVMVVSSCKVLEAAKSSTPQSVEEPELLEVTVCEAASVKQNLTCLEVSTMF